MLKTYPSYELINVMQADENIYTRLNYAPGTCVQHQADHSSFGVIVSHLLPDRGIFRQRSTVLWSRSPRT